MNHRGAVAHSPLIAAVAFLGVGGCWAGERGRDDPLEYFYRPPHGRFVQISSYDTTGGNRDRLELAAGDSAVLLDVAGPGVINRIWITVSSEDPHYLRRIALRMYWDGESEPSVNVPLGDFFGNGFDKRQYASLPLGLSSGGFYSYWPLPFGSRARIVVANGTGQTLDAFYFNIGMVLTAALPRRMLRFHAAWHRDVRTDRPEPHVVLAAVGTGRFVGLSLNAESYAGNLDFLEGDETFIVDGEFRGQGTGTEDYFNSGWYFEDGPFAAQFHGLVVKDNETGRIAAYRWHLPDPVGFQDSILVLLEHGHNNEEIADYATVAYWYQTEPHKPLGPLPSSSRRRVLDVKIPAGAVMGRDLIVRRGGPDATFTLGLARPDRYEVMVYPLGGPGAGDASYRVPGFAVRSVSLEASNPHTVLTPVSLGTMGLSSEVTVHSTPPDVAVPAAVLARPSPTWSSEWNVVGPFPNPRVLSSERSSAADSIYGPEKDPDLSTQYRGARGEPLSWSRAVAGGDGQVRLNPYFQPNDWSTAYAQAFLYSPAETAATLLLGADDAHVLWVNGVRVSERQGRHVSRADDMAVPVRLRAGWNRVLLKVMDLDGGWAFQLRVADPEGKFRWSARQPGGE